MTTALSVPADAGTLIAHLTGVMDSIIGVVEQETELVRAGRLTEAAQLEPAKTALARQYVADTGCVKANQTSIAAMAPDLLDKLRRRHNEFQALLQINLTVLATAHAVSEGIIRGVADELARKAAPQTYGASGRPTAPGPSAAQPLAVSRTL
jgi:hypothetical protein